VADSGSVGELLADDVGVPVTSEDSESLADAMEAVIGNASAFREKADSRVAIYQSRFTAREHAEGMMALYARWLK
jgi:hypothetical protein